MDGWTEFLPILLDLSPEGAAAQKLDLGLNLDTPVTAHAVRASALRINTGFIVGRVLKARIFGLNADALIEVTSGFFTGRVLKTQFFLVASRNSIRGGLSVC